MSTLLFKILDVYRHHQWIENPFSIQSLFESEDFFFGLNISE